MNLPGAISRVVAEAFIAGLWQGIALVVVVAVVLRMMPRLEASARFAVWGLGFLAAMAVPLAHFPGHAGGAGAGQVRVGLGWAFAVAGCWGVLTLVRLVQLVGQGIQLRRIWKEAVPVEVGARIADLLAEMPRKPLLCTSGAVDAPSVIGFWSPKLLIPDWQFGSLTDGEMRQIVLHECEHLRRGDDWMNLAQKAGLALFPLNLALLWADRRLSLERELACDMGVVARTEAPFDYARCLTRLAEQRVGRRSLALTLSAWGRESELIRRVHRLLRPVGSMGRVSMRLSLGLLSLAVAGGSVELARSPRLVAFADLATANVVAREIPLVAQPRSGGARMTPVVYREPARVEMVPAKRREGARHKAAAAQAFSSWPAARTVCLTESSRLACAFLTSASVQTMKRQVSPVDRDRFRLVEAVSTDSSISYAAVPFANGWLILQL